VAESHVGITVVDIGKTDAGVGDSNQHLVALEVVSPGDLLPNRSVMGTFEHCEFNGHVGQFPELE
jgi:hypothetical protein